VDKEVFGQRLALFISAFPSPVLSVVEAESRRDNGCGTGQKGVESFETRGVRTRQEVKRLVLSHSGRQILVLEYTATAQLSIGVARLGQLAQEAFLSDISLAATLDRRLQRTVILEMRKMASLDDMATSKSDLMIR
jgi:hypothetical protein